MLGKIIFKLIMQENNITSLLGGKYFCYFIEYISLAQKHYEITFVNVLVHCVFDKGHQLL